MVTSVRHSLRGYPTTSSCTGRTTVSPSEETTASCSRCRQGPQRRKRSTTGENYMGDKVTIKYPKSIKVGAKSYKVHWSDHEWNNRPVEGREEGAWSMTSHPRLDIWINPELHPVN